MLLFTRQSQFISLGNAAHMLQRYGRVPYAAPLYFSRKERPQR